VRDLVDEISDILSSEELTTNLPVRHLMRPLVRHCRRTTEKEVNDTVKRIAPLLRRLISEAGTWRFKVQVLCECQRAVAEIGLPRLSPALALVEALFDSLYKSEVIEEQYFDFWATYDKDDNPGRMKAMFQLNPFLEFVRDGPYEGESSDEEPNEGEEEEERDDADSEDEGSDIEALVPKRGGRY